MPFTLPGWAVGFVIAIVIISVARGVLRGTASRVGPFVRDGNPNDLERRLADVEEAQRQLSAGDTARLEQRIAELEERVDFAERVLARQNETERLAPPKP